MDQQKRKWTDSIESIKKKKKEGWILSEKSEEKRYRGTKGETSYPILGNICAHRKWGEERNQERTSNSATLDHLVASYDRHGSYGEPIFLPPRPTGEAIQLKG